MQDNIPDALITAFERQYDSSWNDPKLRNERLAMRYGWAAAMDAKQCLYQIQEPAPVLAAPAAVNPSETPNSSTIAVPRGWKLVPDDATPEWVENLEALPDWREAVGECIKKFLAAAPVAPQAAPAAVAVPMAEVWEQSAADTEHQSTGAGLDFNQGVAEGMRICAKDLRAALAATPQNHIADAGQVVENVRKGAPYDNPDFERIARDLGVWGTAQSAICAQFWLAATTATVNQQLTIEREAFEAKYKHLDLSRDRDAWMQEKYKHAAVSLAWESWQARAALAATPAADIGNPITGTAAPVVLPEPDLYVRPSIAAYELPWQVCNGSASAEPAYLAETVRVLLATGGQAQADMPDSFREWFAQNYPADTIIVDPDWHAKSIFRMAQAHARLAAPQAQADARDAEQERWMGIGKAIERACVDLPAGAEINIHLEKDAGTVTLSDCDGDEQENFPTDEGLAGVVNAAIDAAIAAAKGE